ncbi:hypothetical protein ADIS_3454 [Lunatimonas lonarensis]|uniref:Secreted protein n=1 Tax=Lunatimonas lonarensis TaxID=1232681 RepID=R7ZQC0_9BACT|nr:DUF3575 domain-containing protein [Lunatimonas lonarensis]EON76326.1 hypothetical protein ADIS_3454 [Lunatimonas lonarensis]
MKKYVLMWLVALGFSASTYAQSYAELPQNEVKLNIFNTILIGSLELGYESFIDRNQSISAEIHFFDRFGYVSAGSSSVDFDATSFMVGYNYYFVSDAEPSGLYVAPFLKYRAGSFTEVVNNQAVETNLNSFIIGFGGGYKWVHNDKFALGPYVNIARGFNNAVSDRFSAIEFNAGFSIGFRF